MKWHWIALGLAAPLFAQVPEQRPTLGFGLHMGFPTGDLRPAVNDHIGYGVAVQLPLDLGGGLVLRPQIEGTGFRITDYDTLAWLYNYDDREVLRTYRVGVDLLVHFSGNPRRTGPYLIGGVALQNSSYDRLVQDSSGNSVTTSTRLAHWGPAWTAGAGLQFTPYLGAEVRYYRFEYQDPGGTLGSVVTTRPGESLLLGLVVRF